MNNDIIEALKSVLDELEYERVDAWLEHQDGRFEYRGVSGNGLDAAHDQLTTLINQMEGR